MQMCAPLCKSVHQIVSEQEIQLSFTWAASIISSFRWLWHGSNFWGRSSSCSLIPSSGALVSMDIYPLLSIVFHTCRVHCKDEQEKKKCWFLNNAGKSWHLCVKPDCAEASWEADHLGMAASAEGGPGQGPHVCSEPLPELSFLAALKTETGQLKGSP